MQSFPHPHEVREETTGKERERDTQTKFSIKSYIEKRTRSLYFATKKMKFIVFLC